MLTAVVVAGAVIRRLPATYVGLLALAAWVPWAGVAALSVAWLRERGTAPADAEVAFLASLTAHLESGQALRKAIALSAEAAPTLVLERTLRAVEAGLPIEACAELLASALPTQGHAAASALVLAGRTGGTASPVFEALTARATSELDLARELRSGTAGARFSVLLLGGGPLVLVVLRAREALVPGPSGLLVAAGTILTVAGVLVTWAMVRRATR